MVVEPWLRLVLVTDQPGIILLLSTKFKLPALHPCDVQLAQLDVSHLMSLSSV